jgi:hypothetical protein
MEHAAPEIFVTIEQSGFAAAIRQSSWAYAAANVGHILALVMFAAAFAIIDLRLMGALSQVPPGPLIAQARRFAIGAFGGLVATGSMLFAAEASHIIVNPVFQLKLVLIAIGVLNILAFELGFRRRVIALPAETPTPASARIAAGVSLVIWIAVAACGRSIAYF